MTNEERILALLERQEKTLENHGKMLEEHGKMLEEQGKMLADHSKMLADHSKMLERLQVDVSGIKVRLDVEVEKKFQLLPNAAGYAGTQKPRRKSGGRNGFSEKHYQNNERGHFDF